MPRTKPLMIRPPEIRSAIAICSATMIGLSWIGRMLPISAIFARFVWRARIAADIMIETRARRRAVVLVDHQPVEADLVGQDVLVEVVVVVARRDVPIEVGVRHLQAHRRVLEVLAVVKTWCGISENQYSFTSLLRLAVRSSCRPEVDPSQRQKSSGRSIIGEWPQPSMTFRVRVRQAAAVLLAADDRDDPVLAPPDD